MTYYVDTFFEELDMIKSANIGKIRSVAAGTGLGALTGAATTQPQQQNESGVGYGLRLATNTALGGLAGAGGGKVLQLGGLKNLKQVGKAIKGGLRDLELIKKPTMTERLSDAAGAAGDFVSANKGKLTGALGVTAAGALLASPKLRQQLMDIGIKGIDDLKDLKNRAGGLYDELAAALESGNLTDDLINRVKSSYQGVKDSVGNLFRRGDPSDTTTTKVDDVVTDVIDKGGPTPKTPRVGTPDDVTGTAARATPPPPQATKADEALENTEREIKDIKTQLERELSSPADVKNVGTGFSDEASSIFRARADRSEMEQNILRSPDEILNAEEKNIKARLLREIQENPTNNANTRAAAVREAGRNRRAFTPVEEEFFRRGNPQEFADDASRTMVRNPNATSEDFGGTKAIQDRVLREADRLSALKAQREAPTQLLTDPGARAFTDELSDIANNGTAQELTAAMNRPGFFGRVKNYFSNLFGSSKGTEVAERAKNDVGFFGRLLGSLGLGRKGTQNLSDQSTTFATRGPANPGDMAGTTQLNTAGRVNQNIQAPEAVTGTVTRPAAPPANLTDATVGSAQREAGAIASSAPSPSANMANESLQKLYNRSPETLTDAENASLVRDIARRLSRGENVNDPFSVQVVTNAQTQNPGLFNKTLSEIKNNAPKPKAKGKVSRRPEGGNTQQFRREDSTAMRATNAPIQDSGTSMRATNAPKQDRGTGLSSKTEVVNRRPKGGNTKVIPKEDSTAMRVTKAPPQDRGTGLSTKTEVINKRPKGGNTKVVPKEDSTAMRATNAPKQDSGTGLSSKTEVIRRDDKTSLRAINAPKQQTFSRNMSAEEKALAKREVGNPNAKGQYSREQQKILAAKQKQDMIAGAEVFDKLPKSVKLIASNEGLGRARTPEAVDQLRRLEDLATGSLFKNTAPVTVKRSNGQEVNARELVQSMLAQTTRPGARFSLQGGQLVAETPATRDALIKAQKQIADLPDEYLAAIAGNSSRRPNRLAGVRAEDNDLYAPNSRMEQVLAALQQGGKIGEGNLTPQGILKMAKEKKINRLARLIIDRR